MNSKICGLMELRERPNSAFENGHGIVNGSSESAEGSECSNSEGSFHGDWEFDEMCLREFSLSSDICDRMELFNGPSSLTENGILVSNVALTQSQALKILKLKNSQKT